MNVTMVTNEKEKQVLLIVKSGIFITFIIMYEFKIIYEVINCEIVLFHEDIDNVRFCDSFHNIEICD